MAREVNVFVSEATPTGGQAQSPAYEVTVRMVITRRNGEVIARERVVRWPQMLRNIAPERLAEIVREVGIDQMRREEDTDA